MYALAAVWVMRVALNRLWGEGGGGIGYPWVVVVGAGYGFGLRLLEREYPVSSYSEFPITTHSLERKAQRCEIMLANYAGPSIKSLYNLFYVTFN